MRKARLKRNEKNLVRRYLIWCYKTVKEDLDRVDRYFTQLVVDDFVLKQLRKTKEYKNTVSNKAYKTLVDQFQVYMKKKEDSVLGKKFKNSKQAELNPDYLYLYNRFRAVEEAIRYFLGDKELNKINFLYEQEMTKRILEAREHA